MSDADHLAHARAIVATALQLEAGEIDDEASMHTLAAWDSLAHMRIMLAVEETLGHPLASEWVVAIEGVRDIAAALAGAPTPTPFG